jgi:hypothetical protein
MKFLLKAYIFFMLVITLSLLDSCKKCYHCKEYSFQAQGQFRYEEDTCDKSRVEYLRSHNYYCD